MTTDSHGGRQRAPIARALAGAVVLLVSLIAAVPRAEADACSPPANAIVCENSQPGTPPSEWDINGAGDQSIQGFTTEFSVDQGRPVRFKIDTDADDYRLDIYRMGYYGGLGARLMANVEPSAQLPQDQPDCLEDHTTGLIDCGNWDVSASWTVPPSAVSGIYFAKLVRESGEDGASHVFFVVRDDDGGSDILVQTSDTTWQAYNDYGGNSLYKGFPAGRAYKVSYNRPFMTRAEDNGPRQSWVFNAEYPMVRWLERNGYDVSYSSGIDSDRSGAELLEHEAFFSVGHDEYWSAAQRANVEAARDAGVNLAFFTANEVFWKTRWEPSIDGTATPYRTLVSYKETAEGAKIDPDPAWTGTWRDPRFSPPSDGGRPENALTGTIFTVNGPRNDSLQIPAHFGDLRFWRNTSVASLQPGQTATLPPGTLGYEWDEDLDNGFRPAGLFRMSSTTVNVHQHLIDYGTTYVEGPATHHLTMYRASSGALVFGAGTVQWPWGLDDNHDFEGPAPDARMQQATVNLLADMGVQPASLQAGLVAASPSTDAGEPVVQIAQPGPGASLAPGQEVTVSGTADDLGGGVVAGVEVSVDGGATWHPASGTGAWSYRFRTPYDIGPLNIKARAVDDSGNLQSQATNLLVEVANQPIDCPCSIWSDLASPTVAASGDTQAIAVGVKFRSDTDGHITGVRFYKGPGNNSPHTGRLWSAGGHLLASGTFTNESATGWQQLDFTQAVQVSAGTTYVASYHAPQGNYSKDENYFNSAQASGPLTAPSSGDSGGNGVYRYGGSNTFPDRSYRASNYWVDVVFSTEPPPDVIAPTLVSRSPAIDANEVAAATNVSAAFGEPIDEATLSFTLSDAVGNVVPASVGYDAASKTATLDPADRLADGATYTARIVASDPSSNAMAPQLWSFTTAGPVTCPCTIFKPTSTPATASGDTAAVELGLKFRSDTDGYITGIRFYKGPGNDGIHTGRVWNTTGTVLASGTFSNESASGWQQLNFSQPLQITAGTTYVASYHAPQGNYSKNENYFNSSSTFGPLTALQDGEQGGNGLYRYGGSGSFPNKTYKASNYWVDVVFSPTPPPDVTPPALVARTPVPDATEVTPVANAAATFDEAIEPATLDFTLSDGVGNIVPAAVSYDAGSKTATLDPSARLADGAVYTARVVASDGSGNAMAPQVWSFTTRGAITCPCTIFAPSATPGTTSTDPAAVELGVKFRSDTDGYITGVRFYKGPGNNGSHTGRLWSAGGNLLASGTFEGEGATGWQQLNFTQPVQITAGTTYVASYHAPQGNYSKDESYFNSAVTTGALTALRDGTEGGNGLYRYGDPGTFPDKTYKASNYWIDVVFSPQP